MLQEKEDEVCHLQGLLRAAKVEFERRDVENRQHSVVKDIQLRYVSVSIIKIADSI